LSTPLLSTCSLVVHSLPLSVSTLLPYTTLFRSVDIVGGEVALDEVIVDGRSGALAVLAPLLPEGGEPLVVRLREEAGQERKAPRDRKSTRLNSSHVSISYAVFCLKKKITKLLHT